MVEQFEGVSSDKEESHYCHGQQCEEAEREKKVAFPG